MTFSFWDVRCEVYLEVLYTVCFFSSIFRNRAAVSLFLDLWATQRLPSDHKIGSKWHLGQKYFLARLKISLKGGKEKEDTEDLRIWVWYSGCPEMDSCFNPPLLTPNHLKFYPSRLSKWRNLRKCLLEKLLALKNETKRMKSFQGHPLKCA